MMPRQIALLKVKCKKGSNEQKEDFFFLNVSRQGRSQLSFKLDVKA